MAFFSNWFKANRNYREPRSGIEFPETIGSFKREKTTPYEAEPGKPGVAISYESGDAAVTIYLRAKGVSDHNTSEEYLKDSLAATKALEEQGKYSNVKIYEFDLSKEKAGWRTGAFTSRSDTHFLVSFILCKIAPGYLVKIRATTGNPKNDALQSFLGELQEFIDRKSR